MVRQGTLDIKKYGMADLIKRDLSQYLNICVQEFHGYRHGLYAQLPGWLNSLCQDFHSTCIEIKELGLDDAVSEVKT